MKRTSSNPETEARTAWKHLLNIYNLFASLHPHAACVEGPWKIPQWAPGLLCIPIKLWGYSSLPQPKRGVSLVSLLSLLIPSLSSFPSWPWELSNGLPLITGSLAKRESENQILFSWGWETKSQSNRGESRNWKCWKHPLPSPHSLWQKNKSSSGQLESPTPRLQRRCVGQSPSVIPTLQREKPSEGLALGIHGRQGGD